jgi:hypothetical protein
LKKITSECKALNSCCDFPLKKNSTCLDYLLFGRGDSSTVDSLKEVSLHFLQYGLSFTLNVLWADRISEQICYCKQRNIEWEDALDCNDAVKVILERSATRLEELIQSQPEILKEYSEGISLLEWADRIAWLEGCEILWKHRSLLDLRGKEAALASIDLTSCVNLD